MAEQTEQARTVVRNKEAEQKNLANALKAPEEGGANLGIEAGTDINTLPEETKKQITEEVNRRTYGISNPQFRDNVADMIDDGTEGAAGGQAVTDSTPARTEMADLSTELEEMEATQAEEAAKDKEVIGLTDEQRALFTAQEELSTDTFEAAKESIESSTEAALQEAELSQAKQRGASRVQLARMGALGVSSAATQYLGDLENSFRKELAGIRERGQQLMQEASLAKRQGDLQLMRDRMDAIRLNREDALRERQAYLQEVETMQRITQFNRETASTTLTAMAEGGIKLEDVPETYFNTLDKEGGYTPGTSQMIFSAAVDAAEKTDVQDRLDIASTLYTSVLPNMPKGEFIEIDGVKYYGERSSLTFQGTQVDTRTGDILSVLVDESTGEIVVNSASGYLSPEVNYSVENINGKFWYVPDDPSQGPAVPMLAQETGGANGVNIGRLQADLPHGISYNKDGKALGLSEKDFWCLRFIGNLDKRGQAFMNEVGDSIESKRNSVEDIGFGEGQMPPQVGDYILTNEDSQYGHIGLITDIRQNEQGQTVAVITESNKTPLTVTHNRTIVLDQNNMEMNGGIIMGFKKSQLLDEYTNQSTQQLTEFGTTEPPEIKKINGQDFQWDSEKGQWVDPFGDLPEGENADELAKRVLEEQIRAVEEIINHKGLDNAVGITGIQRTNVFGLGRGARYDFVNKVENLISEETLNKLIELKSEGGTLGALSDTELQMLRSAATELAQTPSVLDGDGNKEGYKASNKNFKASLEDIKQGLLDSYERNFGSSETYRIDADDERVQQARNSEDYEVQDNGDGTVTIIKL